MGLCGTGAAELINAKSVYDGTRGMENGESRIGLEWWQSGLARGWTGIQELCR